MLQHVLFVAAGVIPGFVAGVLATCAVLGWAVKVIVTGPRRA